MLSVGCSVAGLQLDGCSEVNDEWFEVHVFDYQFWEAFPLEKLNLIISDQGGCFNREICYYSLCLNLNKSEICFTILALFLSHFIIVSSNSN